MQLPFTFEQFVQVVFKYNKEIFPVQIIFYLSFFLIIYFIVIGNNSKISFYILSLIWFWNGTIYHILYLTSINIASYLFGFLFILQAVAFFFYAKYRKEIVFSNKLNIYTATGWIIIIYALLIYPWYGYANGHHFLLGTPCPVAIFTIGILLFTNKAASRLIIIPCLWAVIDSIIVFKFSIFEDYGLIISGLLTLVMLYYRDGHINKYLRHT